MTDVRLPSTEKAIGGGDPESAAVDPPAAGPSLSLMAAFAAFDCLREELFALFQDVRHGKSELARKLAPAITDLGRALGTLLREYDKVEEYRRRNGSDLYNQAIDLGAASDEIGRRLARLRTAGRAGSVSGGSVGE